MLELILSMGTYCCEVPKERLEMKALLISFVVGLLVGVAYGVIRVKSPAPPISHTLETLGSRRGVPCLGVTLIEFREDSGNLAPEVALVFCRPCLAPADSSPACMRTAHRSS